MNKTTIYRQIDYLRLFRLCKDIGLIKHKRKMPVECVDEKNPNNSSKRIMTALVKHLFPNYISRNDSNSYFLTLPKDVSDSLNILSSRPANYFTNAGSEGTEASAKFTALKQNLRGHVVPNFPHEIRINIMSGDVNDKYQQLIRAGVKTFRPRENFYSCARACIEYKKMWDESISFLVEFVRLEEGRKMEREAEQKRLKQERRRLERERLEQEKKEQTQPIDKEKEVAFLKAKELELAKARELEQLKANEETKVLMEQIEREKQIRLQGAQNSFERALDRFRRDTNG